MQKRQSRKEILPLFSKFIQESKKGTRVHRDGKRLSPATISNYYSTFRYLKLLNEKSLVPLSINIRIRINKLEFLRDKKYWNLFFFNFKKVMYNNGCTDNYVGMCIKVLKTFFKYLEEDKNYPIANFYKLFYPPHFENQILVIDQEKLRFLIADKTFDCGLLPNLKLSKDLLIVGCTIGLRFSDLISLKKANIQKIEGSLYIITISKKTTTPTRIKVPSYILEIIKTHSKGNLILPKISLSAFNKNIKRIGELAGWTYQVGKECSINGVRKEIKTANGSVYRFCDMLCSHVMRKTAITTLLLMGMPEPLVRKISGHAANSKEFYKYVKYTESFMDTETDKAFDKLMNPL